MCKITCLSVNMKNKTNKELAELVNTTLEEGDIAGHLAALGNLDPNFQVTVLNPQTIEIKNLPDTEKKKSFASGLQNLIEDFFEFLGFIKSLKSAQPYSNLLNKTTGFGLWRGVF